MRNILTDSTNPFHALTAALCCRAVGIRLENNKGFLKNESVIDDNGNENQNVENGNEGEIEKAIEKDVSCKNRNEEKKEEASSPEDETPSSLSEWENVSKDTCQFSLLISNLEDITILNAIVR